VITHDPQPMGVGSLARRDHGVRAIWRCHIGHDRRTPGTRAAWEFLRPWADAYDHAVFSAPEYIPDYFAGRATIIHPALDPLSHKNRPSRGRTSWSASSATPAQGRPAPDPHAAVRAPRPRLRPTARSPGVRRRGDRAALPAVVTQVSRWDRLKGFDTLLDAFVALKRRLDEAGRAWEERHRRRIKNPQAGARRARPGGHPGRSGGGRRGGGAEREVPIAAAAFQEDIALLSLPMSRARRTR